MSSKIQQRVSVKVKPLAKRHKSGTDGTRTSFEGSNIRPSIYGLHQGYDRGYGVAHRDINPREYKSRNAQFVNQLNEDIWFWVDEIEINFEAVGITSQSKKTRQFYFHHMAQPSIQVRGTAPSNHFYNQLSAFVRASQYYSVSGRELKIAGIDTRTMHGPTGKAFRPTISFNLYDRSSDSQPSRKQHLDWRLEGYVKNIRAGGERANVAPSFQFEFVIAEVIADGKSGKPLFDDDLIAGRQILSWMDIFKSRGQRGFVKDPTPTLTTKKDDPDDFNTQVQDLADHGQFHL